MQAVVNTKEKKLKQFERQGANLKRSQDFANSRLPKKHLGQKTVD